MNFIVAIDGPSASGKSTVSKLIATKLGFSYLDTGAMYRAHTLFVIENNIDPYNESEVSKALDKIDIKFDKTSIYLNGKDVSKEIRKSEVTNLVSIVCAYKKVREFMVEKQREIAENGQNGVILDGRDIGTVVFPDATLKIYLVANSKNRALRRQKDFEKLGTIKSIEVIENELLNRDKLDSSRENSPLRKASDAIEIDNSNITLEQTADKIIELINSKNVKK